ncbi:increased DNA methylation 2-like [Tasmannia lanceolata]|uniref:increased DNA methylation 2-like n=1 Tax=Tasmannia lanceolata TaxID=3420 RepID=UPI0040632DC7
MDNLSQPESLTPVASEPSTVPNWMETTGEQHFLLLFIMGTYFGPDLKDEKPKKSVLQRIAEGLPPYTTDQLAGSQMRTMEMERVYYYVLRNANQSVIIKRPLFRQLLEGSLCLRSLDSTADHHQLPDLFPLHLHRRQRQYKKGYKIIENVIFINNPEISYIKPGDVEKFKRLTGLENLLLDRDAARFHGSGGFGGVTDHVANQESNGKLDVRRSSRRSRRKRQLYDDLETQEGPPPVSGIPHCGVPLRSIPLRSIPYSGSVLPTEEKVGSVEKVGPAMLFLPSPPTVEEWDNIVTAGKKGIAVTGTVAERQVGPPIGLVDIGVCESAYLFHISLPGVKKDENKFSIEINGNGRVVIKGETTTGERVISKNGQVFVMQTQNLCSSGHFSVSFHLPGPVEYTEFSGSFRGGGILEGVVMKKRMKNE